MSDELVRRLRGRGAELMRFPLGIGECEADGAAMTAAADKIERLRAEVGKLRVQRAGEDVRLADAISERDRLRAEVAETGRRYQQMPTSQLPASG